MALGASYLKTIFDESFYNEKEGGLLGGLGQIFKNPARLYVYPHLDLPTGQVITAANFRVAPHLKHLYRHLLENGFLRDIRHYDPELLPIRRRDVLAKIQSGDSSWEDQVPPQIVAVIKRGRLFGYTEERVTAGA